MIVMLGVDMYTRPMARRRGNPRTPRSVARHPRRLKISTAPGIHRWLAGTAGKTALLVLAILLLATFLRLFALGDESIWLDEALSIEIVKGNVPSILDGSVNSDVHPPLYFLVLDLWVLVFGDSEAGVRALSACLGVISVFLMYRVGRELYRPRVGLVAAALLAISVYAIQYSQEARPYSLLLLLTLSSYLLFIRMLNVGRPRWTHAALYALVNILLCYTHVFGLLVIGTQALYFLLYGGRYWRARRAFWCSQASALLCFSPWVYVLATRTYGQAHTLDWIPEPSLRLVAEMMGALSGAGLLWLPLGALLMLAFLFLGIAGVFCPARNAQTPDSPGSQPGMLQRAARSVAEPRAALLLMWFLAPLVLTIIFSVSVRSLLVSRYLISITPALYLLVALGIERIGAFGRDRGMRGHLLTLGLVGLIALISLQGLYEYYTSPQKDPWREVSQLVQQKAKAGDAIVFYPDYYRIPFDYYYAGDPEISEVPYETIESGGSAAGRERVWLIRATYEDAEAATAEEALIALYGSDSVVLREEFPHVTVDLFRAADNPPGDSQHAG
jgi:mannosyltransferase